MNAAVKFYVPRDPVALAVEADAVAFALKAECGQRGLAIELIRNGSCGLFWLKTMVEAATPQGRMAHGLLTVDDVAGLLDADLLNGGTQALGQGLTEQIPHPAKQECLTFARMGITDPFSLDDHQAHEWQREYNRFAPVQTELLKQRHAVTVTSAEAVFGK